VFGYDLQLIWICATLPHGVVFRWSSKNFDVQEPAGFVVFPNVFGGHVSPMGLVTSLFCEK